MTLSLFFAPASTSLSIAVFSLSPFLLASSSLIGTLALDLGPVQVNQDVLISRSFNFITTLQTLSFSNKTHS